MYVIITYVTDSLLHQGSDETGTYTITGIIRVFVDAYPHIPEHRRLALFSQLLQAVGDYKYLHVCAALCIEALVTSSPIPDSSDEYEWKVCIILNVANT